MPDQRAGEAPDVVDVEPRKRPRLSWRFAARVGLIVISDDGLTYSVTPYGRSFE